MKILGKWYIPGVRYEHTISQSHTMSHNQAHREYEVYYQYRGERIYFIENRTYSISSGTLVFIGSNRIHKTISRSPEQHERFLFEIEDSFFQHWQSFEASVSFSELKHHVLFVIKLDESERFLIEHLLFAIDRAFIDRKSGYAAVVSSLVFLLLRFIEDNGTQSTPISEPKTNKEQKVFEMTEYINRNIKGDLSLEEMSQRFFMSKSTICHAFKEVTGLSFGEYVNTRRIQQARILLEETKLSISEIAASVGYDSSAKLRRIFDHHLSMTPREYRKNAELKRNNPHYDLTSK